MKRIKLPYITILSIKSKIYFQYHNPASSHKNIMIVNILNYDLLMLLLVMVLY